MEIALSALASFSAPAAATAAAGVASASVGGLAATELGGAAAGGGILSALTSSPVIGLLSGASTAVSIIQQLRAGEIKADSYDLMATQAKAQGVAEQADFRARATSIKRELLATLGENDVAYAAGGTDISYGEAATRRSRTTTLAYDEIAANRASADAKTAVYDLQALQYGRLSHATRSGSQLSAWATGLEGAARLAYRGFA